VKIFQVEQLSHYLLRKKGTSFVVIEMMERQKHMMLIVQANISLQLPQKEICPGVSPHMGKA
jgi:hypothetical protein